MPTLGRPAPAFTLPSTSGRDVSLAGLRGKRVVLYFYPRDDTPGCTREACGFRDSFARLRKDGVVVLGVSKDSLAAHARFRTKYALPFDLLTDEDNAVAKLYGAYGKKKMYGKDVLGTIRSTSLIDAQGRIERIWSPVKVDGHVDAVLAALHTGEPAAKKGTASARKAGPRSKPAAKRAPAKRTAKRTAKQPAKKTAKKSAKKSAKL